MSDSQSYQDTISTDDAAQRPAADPNVAAAPDPVNHEQHIGDEVPDDEGVSDAVDELADKDTPPQAAATGEPDEPVGY